MAILTYDYRLAHDDPFYNQFMDWLDTCPYDCGECKMRNPCDKVSNHLNDIASNRRRLRQDDVEKAMACIRKMLIGEKNNENIKNR
jgi:hypothetical protein